MTFHQGGDMTVVGAAQQVALPMTGDGAILDLGGTFSIGNGVDDLTHARSPVPRVPRAANSPLGPQVPNQFFFQHPSRLNEQAAVDGLVRQAHTPVIAILVLQPSPKSDPATSPESVYSQRSPATSHGRQEDTPWAASIKSFHNAMDLSRQLTYLGACKIYASSLDIGAD
jgi:hypothetical protein